MSRLMNLLRRKNKVKIVEDHLWMKPECKAGCPYFVDGQNNKEGLSHCVRPFGERCLAENMLVQMAISKKGFQDED